MLELIQLKIPAQPLTQNPVRGDLSVVIPAHKTSAAHHHRYAIPTEATSKINTGQAKSNLIKEQKKKRIMTLYFRQLRREHSKENLNPLRIYE